MKKLLSYLYRYEWSVFIGVLAAVVLEVQHQVQTDGTTPDWRSLVPVIAGAIIRQNVTKRGDS